MMPRVAPGSEMVVEGQDREKLQAKFDELCLQVAQRPLDADLRARLGYAALDLGRRMEAIGAFVRALQIEPSLDFLRARLQAICTPEELKMFHVPEEVVPFWKDFPGLLAWPFCGRGLGILVMGTLFATVTNAFGSSGIIRVLICSALFGYLASYFIRIVKTSGVGQKEPPDWPDVSHPIDLMEFALQWSLGWLATFLPAIVVLLLPGLDLSVRLVGAGMCAMVGIFLYPMAMLVTCLYGSGFCAFQYPFLVRSIMRIPREYLLAWAVLLAFSIVLGAVYFGGGLMGFGVLSSADPDGVGMFMANLLFDLFATAVSFYGYMVFCRVLGQLYQVSSSKLGWFEASDAETAESPHAPGEMNRER